MTLKKQTSKTSPVTTHPIGSARKARFLKNVQMYTQVDRYEIMLN